MKFSERVTKELVESCLTYTDILNELKLPATQWNRVKLKAIITRAGFIIGNNPNKLGKGIWASLNVTSLQCIVNNCYNWSDLARSLGYNVVAGSIFNTIKLKVDTYNIDTSHFTTEAQYSRQRIPHNELFIEHSMTDGSTVKKRILKEELIPYICSGCGNEGVWEDQPLVLQLEHKNGTNNDHRLCNLEFRCPNCHTQTNTWGRKKRQELNASVAQDVERLTLKGRMLVPIQPEAPVMSLWARIPRLVKTHKQ